ncbi:unnamed protein product [Trichobilharzia regenti]|uniref:Suppressor protein SRP40-like n=1 Tax=Trichobilharzia regenti TaxID=157069 RepID=A0A183W9I3_TRIRE|nr:unnamed protein product [Trichobilharzia regenti]VDQ04665.1 unnamed protein product [Trichobilharzia regenti]
MSSGGNSGIRKIRNTSVTVDEENKENLEENLQVTPINTWKNVSSTPRKTERIRRLVSKYNNDFIFDDHIIKIITSNSPSESSPKSNVKMINVHQLMETTRAIGEQLVESRGQINSSSINELSSLLQLSVNDNCQPLRKKLEKGKINDQIEDSSKYSLPNQSVVQKASTSTALSDVNPPYNDKNNVIRTNWYSKRNAYLTLLSEIQNSSSDSSTTTYPSSSSSSSSLSAHNSLDRCVQNNTSSTNKVHKVSKNVLTAQDKALHKLQPNIMGYRWNSKEEAYGASSSEREVETLLSWK